MNNLIIYSLEVAICLALFYLAYWLFLKKETFFKLNRSYLVFSAVISLLMPVLNITIAKDSFINKNLLLHIDQYEQSMMGNTIMDDEMIFSENNNNAVYKKSNELHKSPDVGSNALGSTSLNAPQANNPDEKINWLTALLVVYFIGVALFLLRFIANFIWIFAYALKHTSQQISGMKVIRLEKKISPFSFLNFIFISKEDYPEAELAKIISHEKIHIQQKHSVDIILFELLLIFQWFNPFVWFYKNAIKITHEYLADEGTLNSGVDLTDYQYSLLNQVLRKNNFEIASNYNLTIKKRIEMMIKKRSPKLAPLKLAIALPLLVFLFSAFAFNTNIPIQEAKPVATTNGDTSIKRISVPVEYLRSLQGEYLSTNEPNYTRRIIINEAMGELYGYDNGYTYKIIPVAEGKFINPDDMATLEFNTKDKNAMSLLLFGKINLNKVKEVKGQKNIKNKSLAFTLANTAAKDGITAARSYYNKAKDSANYYVVERDMNYAGYALLESSKAKEAAEIFKINTELYPNSFNAYDSYGEALFIVGEKTKAIDAFKNSLKFNPGCVNALKRLKELGVSEDDLPKHASVTVEYLKLLEGTYLSTNEKNWVRMIRLVEENGVLVGTDNGYRYKLIPMGNGKFINPDDGVALVFDAKDKNAISLLIFGTVVLKKIKISKESGAPLKDYIGNYFPATKKDSALTSMEIISKNNKLFRFIEVEPQSPNKSIELEFVTDNIFYYTDNSGRSIDFTVNDKKQVTGCTVRRADGIYKFLKK